MSTLKLKSNDDVIFEVKKEAAVQSKTLKNMMDADCANDVIPISEAESKTLGMIIEYWNQHAEGRSSEKETKDWDGELVKQDEAILYHLLMAANYVDVEKLVDLICRKVADMIRGKQPDQIRELLKIENDFKPEEEQEIGRQNAWAYQ